VEQPAGGEMMLIFGWSATVGRLERTDVAELGPALDRDRCVDPLRI
jgi:hypothetical protein